jgi:hypothetical protein
MEILKKLFPEGRETILKALMQAVFPKDYDKYRKDCYCPTCRRYFISKGK